MIITCHNCLGSRHVWNGRRLIACPVCGNRGIYERAEQPDLFAPGRITIYRSVIRPDSPRRRNHP